MNDPVLIRKLLREALSMSPDRWFIETLLYKSVGELLGGKLSVAEFNGARNWNKAEGYIESRTNKHYEQDEWKLTKAGKKQEGI